MPAQSAEVSHPADSATDEAPVNVAPADDTPELVESDLLVEDVSIDGMCGVY